MHTLAHQLVLLELDDTTGKSLISDGTLRHAAIAGALIAELQLRERLVPAAADRFAVAQGASRDDDLPVLRQAEAWLPSRPRPLKRCVARLTNRGRALRNLVLEDLVAAGALRQEQDRLWIIPYRTRWPTAAPAVEATLVEHLRAWLAAVRPTDPPGREDLLLSLARVGKLLGTVWHDAELVRLKPTIVERTARAPIGRTVRDVVREAHAAAAAVAASAAT